MSSTKMEPSKKKLKTAAGSSAVQGGAAMTATSPPVELLETFHKLKNSWPHDMTRLLDPSLPDERRSKLWEIMCEGGDDLRKRFGWAIPDHRALRILTHFSPIVEVGSGLGYWAKLLRSRGADIVAYDKVAGEPAASGKSSSTENQGTSKDHDEGVETPSFWVKVNKGGPEVLEEPCNKGRSLFLCYPDDFEDETESLGLRCLHAYEGDVVIHVGELFGDSISMRPGQSPWGRTTSQECQEELASKFHCILKVPLPSWPHARDTLTVWKRNSFCAIYYDDDSEEDRSGDGQEEGAKRKGDTKGSEDDGTNEASERGGEGCSDSKEGSHTSGSDDTGSVERLTTGMPDVDMYAFVPAKERLPCGTAAACVYFLLDRSVEPKRKK